MLVVNIHFAPETYGGATVVAEEVSRALIRDHGVRVTAVSAMARPDLPPYAVLLCEVDGIPNYRINLPPGRAYAEHYANPQVAEAIGRIAREIAPDLVHLHCVQEIGADCIAVLKAGGLPVVLSTHDYWWLCERQFMLRPGGVFCPEDPVRPGACRGCVDDAARAETRRARLAALAGMADLVTAPSVFSRDLHARSGIAPGRIVTWENGVTLPGPGFFAAQARRRAADPRVTFGFLGGPSEMKGWPLIAGAFTRLGRRDFRVVVAEGSRDGSWYRDRDLTRFDGDWEVRPGYGQEGIDAAFAEIDVLLFPSQWQETYGLTLREALCRGLRVIQTEAGGTLEHGRRDAVVAMPLGAGPEALRAAVLAELGRRERGAEPRPVRGWSEQAAEFLALVEVLLDEAPAAAGAA